MEINEGQPNANEQRLFIQALQYKGVSHHRLRFGGDSQAGRGVGKLYRGKKGRLQVCPEWQQLA